MIGVNALPLLAYKVGPNLFDLSSQMHNVSIRDQMHRAVVLAEALVGGNQFDQPHSQKQVLIVGAGVAGVSAGIVFARHGVEVLIIDSSERAPFALQRDVTQRYVGPYMYEWPLEVYKSQRLPADPETALAVWQDGIESPLKFLDTDPVTPSSLVADWDAQLEQAVAKSGYRLHVQTHVDSAQSNLEVKNWLTAQRGGYTTGAKFVKHEVKIAGSTFAANSTPVTGTFTPRFVLLAAGMGAETYAVNDSSGTPVQRGAGFWGNDDWVKPNLGKYFPPDVAVLGGGDGALQDVLRALTGDKQPLKTWDRLLALDPTGLISACQQRILALEHQHAQLSIWSNSGETYKALDGAYRAIAQGLAKTPHITRAVCSLIRPDVNKVHLFVKSEYFTKAYALNRFLVHLIEHSFFAEDNQKFILSRNMEAEHVEKRGSQIEVKFQSGEVFMCDILAVRFGADTTNLPKTWLGLEIKDTENRQELAAVPLPLYIAPSK